MLLAGLTGRPIDVAGAREQVDACDQPYSKLVIRPIGSPVPVSPMIQSLSVVSAGLDLNMN